MSAAVPTPEYGLKTPLGRTDDGLQVALGQEQFAEAGGGVGRAEKDTVRHNYACPSAGSEMVNEPLQE